MTNLSIVNPQNIRNHLANNSPSKIAHQFSKTKRFPDPNPYCPIAFYTFQSRLSNRKTSLGYGRKSDFTKDLTVSPPSTLYKHKSIFQQKEKGKSFGLSREQSPDNSYLIPQLQKVPGPGQYQNQVKTKMNISYTLRPRTIDAIGKNLTWRKAPGPGTYQSIQLEPKTGRFMYSKYQDSKFAKITDLGPRFHRQKDCPGPSSYKEGNSMSPAAKYVLSQHKGRGTRPFNKTGRSHFTQEFARNKKTPGPGTYEKPTDFGVYGDAKYYKTLGSLKSTIE